MVISVVRAPYLAIWVQLKAVFYAKFYAQTEMKKLDKPKAEKKPSREK